MAPASFHGKMSAYHGWVSTPLVSEVSASDSLQPWFSQPARREFPQFTRLYVVIGVDDGFRIAPDPSVHQQYQTDSDADRGKTEQGICKSATECNQNSDDRGTSHADEDKS